MALILMLYYVKVTHFTCIYYAALYKSCSYCITPDCFIENNRIFPSSSLKCQGQVKCKLSGRSFHADKGITINNKVLYYISINSWWQNMHRDNNCKASCSILRQQVTGRVLIRIYPKVIYDVKKYSWFTFLTINWEQV